MTRTGQHRTRQHRDLRHDALQHRPPRHLVRRVLAVGATLCAVLAASGCDTNELGAAAVVGDRRISVADLQTATQQIQILAGQGSTVAQTDVLMFLIVAPQSVDLAARNGVGVSRDTVLADYRKNGNAKPSAVAVLAAQSVLSLNQFNNLGQQDAEKATAAVRELLRQIKAEHITVNPRYGTFSPDKLTFSAASQNWLEVTATPSASASTSQ